ERHGPADPENENRLARFQARLRLDHSPGSEPGDAERGRLKEIETLRLSQHASLRRADELGEGPVDLLAENARPRAQNLFAPTAEFARPARLHGIDDDGIAVAESRARVGLFDHAGAVEPEDDGQPMSDPRAAVAQIE